MNCKRKLRRRFFLLMRSRTPPIYSEFRGGGEFEHPKPPSVRHCFGTNYRSHPQCSRMGPTSCPETSVRNYHLSLRNNPEERSSQLLHGGSLQSRNVNLCWHNQMVRSALFLDFTQRVLIVCYRRFETNYRYLFQGSICNKQPTYTAYNYRRAQVSFIRRRKPETTH